MFQTQTEEALELQVICRAIETLIPFARNARTHSRSQIRKLRDSIQSFGFVNPVLINQAGTTAQSVSLHHPITKSQRSDGLMLREQRYPQSTESYDHQNRLQ
jgi:hypothetical protein